jgi:biopolymer transport protein ExbD
MHVPSPFRDRRTSVELQLTPMIDCVFLLMIYFIWSSSFAIAEMSLPSKLSAQAGGSGAASINEPPPEADFPSVVVRVLWTGSGPIWTVNEKPVRSLAELRQTLAALARLKRDAPVIIDPASDVPLGDVIDVFDLSRVVGLQKIQFAASIDGLRPENQGKP